MNSAALSTSNLLILGWIAFAAALQLLSPDFYYMSVQEDEYLEWSTFWAFIGAAALQLGAARRRRADTGGVPWFHIGIALFCGFVAMEEISWGQRLLGYRPPEYFLRENFQQEPNLHNVFDTSLRKLTLQLVIAVYGIVLPAAARVAALRPLLNRFGIVAHSPALIPAFAGTLALYIIYPWSFCGEVVELMLGFGFLFSAPSARPAAVATIVGMFVAVVVLGAATSMTARLHKSSDEAYAALAQAEVDALGKDFLAESQPDRSKYVTRCNLHKRVYTYVEKYRQSFLAQGRFSELTGQGLAEERAQYFLDPWNAPYWIRDNCDDHRRFRSIFVYSFGPNHRRDSSENELRADDVGFYIKSPRTRRALEERDD